MGASLLADRKPAEAADAFRAALDLDPTHAPSSALLGVALAELGRLDEALPLLHAAADRDPDDPRARLNLGVALAQAARPADAARELAEAVRLDPAYDDAVRDLGHALRDLGRFPDAVAAYEAALRLRPAAADVLTNLASADKERDRLAEAITGYDIALSLDPESATARYNRSLALLKSGDYGRGFAEYEWRWRRGRTPSRLFAKPRWDGSPLAGRTVLLWCEQGQGDAVQFVRFAAEAERRGGRAIVECPRPLAGLFASCPGVAAVAAEGDELPAYDVQCPLMSVPAVIGTTLETVPASVPYLAADPARVTAWREKLAALPGRRVGVAWQGNPRHRWDRFRSVPLEAFAPLASVPGVTLVSLQHGSAASQVRQVANRFSVAELAWSDPPSWDDTAAVLANLDLVVTVDTAVAHVAGALGMPTWVLIGAVSDWRWLVDRGDSPWYPTMRLYRQRDLSHWEPVFERIVADLRAWAAPSAVPTRVPTPLAE